MVETRSSCWLAPSSLAVEGQVTFVKGEDYDEVMCESLSCEAEDRRPP